MECCVLATKFKKIPTNLGYNLILMEERDKMILMTTLVSARKERNAVL